MSTSDDYLLSRKKRGDCLKHMLPRYKLTYFNAQCRGEVVRLILTYAGVDYEDVRLEFSKWPEVKHETPYGQLPLLEVDDGTILTQSLTIARYLAREHGLAGRSNLQAALCDALVETFWLDLMPKWVEGFMSFEDKEKKQSCLRECEELLAFFTPRFEKVLEENETGYLVGDTVTWADLVFAHGYASFQKQFGDKVLQDYPRLTKLVDTINNIPSIKEWMSKRPQTEF